MADRTLVAVYTCHRYDYSHPLIQSWIRHPVLDRVSALRETWLQDVDVEYRLFSGSIPNGYEKREPKHDEVFLNAPDGYYTTNQKTRELARWALENNYNRLLKVDDDVYVHWDRMRRSPGFSEGEYVGGGYTPGEGYAFGGCYWLGERALAEVASSPANSPDWAEDRWVGLSLSRAGIRMDYEHRYYYEPADESTRLQYISEDALFSNHEYISLHAVRPEVMVRYHAQIGRGA